MTQPDPPERSQEATPPQEAAGGPAPLPSAPPISEAYGASPPPGGQYAGRGARLLAAIIDGVITSAIGWIIAAPIVGVGAMYGTKHLGARLGANVITAVVAVLYYALQHGKWGQTIGKRALSIRVVLADGGGAIGYGAAFGRVVFTYVISIVTCGIGGLVDVAWILGDERRQALHDKVVKTVVVQADGPDPYAGV